MNTNEVTQLLKLNKSMYQSSARPLTDDVIAVQLAVWAAALKDVPAEAGFLAIQRAFTVCRFPVTLADLYDKLRALQAESSTPVATVWESILKAAHRAADNVGRYRYTCQMEDGRTQGQQAKEENQALFAGLPGMVRDWLGSPRALAEIDFMDATAQNFRRKEFEKAYSEHLQNSPLCPALLSAAVEGTKAEPVPKLKEAAQ